MGKAGWTVPSPLLLPGVPMTMGFLEKAVKTWKMGVHQTDSTPASVTCARNNGRSGQELQEFPTTITYSRVSRWSGLQA